LANIPNPPSGHPPWPTSLLQPTLDPSITLSPYQCWISSYGAGNEPVPMEQPTMPTNNATPAPAAAFYAEFPYLVRLALACEESEAFLETDAFLEAPTAEEGVQRHIEIDAALADKYGLGSPDQIWRAFAARDIGRILTKLALYRGRTGT